MSRAHIALVLLAASCSEYSVSFEQQSETPLPVTFSRIFVEMPVGIVVTAWVRLFEDDEELSADTDLAFVVDDPTVLDLVPVVDDTSIGPTWALAAAATGTTTIRPTVKGHDAVPIDVVITDQ